MRVGSLFTGVGGFDIAAERTGWFVAWQSEVDKYCNVVLNERWDLTPNLGSVEEIRAGDYTANGHVEDVDLIVGGSPCQGFSIAGIGMGLQDERSGLFGEMVRVAHELQPEWLVWENVPGALTSGKGEDFANVLAAMVGSPAPLLLPKHPNGRRSRYAGVARGPLGTFAWRTVDAQHFGVPQRRSRVIGVRHADASMATAALFDDFVWPDPEVDCDDAWAAGVDHDETPFDWGDEPENPKRVRLRDCVETDPAEYEGFVLSEKACTGILERATRRGKDMPPLLEAALRVTAGLEVDQGLAQRALGSVSDEELRAVLAVNREGAFVFRKSRRAASSEDYETWVPDDAGNTLNTFENSDVRATNLVVCHPDPAGNLTERYHKGVNTTFDDGAVVIDLAQLSVRRLTPRECERLQGFPDDHTRVKGVSNTQRFKQMGNAVAIPVAEWVFERISRIAISRIAP